MLSIEKSRLNKVLSLSSAVLVLALFGPACVADEEADWVDSLKESSVEPGLRARALKIGEPDNEKSDLLKVVNNQSPASKRTHAASQMRDGNFDLAIQLIEEVLEVQPEDNEARQIYADALETKWKSRSLNRDPHLFNQCVKQWYYLYKNAEYPTIVSVAGNHLRELTGKSPYVWPTAKMYLKRVLLPEQDGTEPDTTLKVSEEPQLVH